MPNIPQSLLFVCYDNEMKILGFFTGWKKTGDFMIFFLDVFNFRLMFQTKQFIIWLGNIIHRLVIVLVAV